MKKVSHFIWLFRWLQRLFSALVRRRDVVDLLPSILVPSRRLVFDSRIGGFRSFKLRRQLSDYWAYDQCLATNGLDLDPYPQGSKLRATYEKMLDNGIKPIILDCGANIGFSAYWLGIEYPKATVIAVEPDYSNAQLAEYNTRHCNNVQVIQAAVASKTCRLSLTNTDQGSDAFRTLPDESGEITGHSIATLVVMADGALDDLLLVKIDIEGFENDLFSANLDWVYKAQAIIVEPHDWMIPGQATANNLLQAISNQPRDFLVHGEHVMSFHL
jgi:FkbM family methyltransferase